MRACGSSNAKCNLCETVDASNNIKITVIIIKNKLAITPPKPLSILAAKPIAAPGSKYSINNSGEITML